MGNTGEGAQTSGYNIMGVGVDVQHMEQNQRYCENFVWQ